MYTKGFLKLFLYLWVVFFWSGNFYAYAETCSSGSGTSCSMSCSEGTLTLVCNKSEETCSGSCSKANNQESAAYNLLADIFVATGKRIPLDEIAGKLKDAPMDIEGNRYDLNFGSGGNITVIIKTDFYEFNKSDWYRAVARSAEQLKSNLK